MLTLEQRFKLRSIISIASLLRITLDWATDNESQVIVCKDNPNAIRVVVEKDGNLTLSSLTILPKVWARGEVWANYIQHSFPMNNLEAMPIREYAELYQIELLKSI